MQNIINKESNNLYDCKTLYMFKKSETVINDENGDTITVDIKFNLNKETKAGKYIDAKASVDNCR